MQILKISPYSTPLLQEIDGSLESMQSLVDGYIEAVTLTDRLVLICNEEGKMRDLPDAATLTARGGLTPLDVVAGDCFVCGVQGDDFCSIKTEDIEEALLYVHPVY